MIVDREHDNHREIKSVSRCEVVQSFVKMRFDGAFNRYVSL
ncbi:unnamed protein product [Callosobruchus maculatus]|uniref:Uncharacterized protein n=1 Tax=Callosobruchus maculatus TaxID=64391 RepID=A0A653DD00_CALMS|nr:unnamed protein product [Callosobruchus maculatus]